MKISGLEREEDSMLFLAVSFIVVAMLLALALLEPC